jgi:hypothetical protein
MVRVHEPGEFIDKALILDMDGCLGRTAYWGLPAIFAAIVAGTLVTLATNNATLSATSIWKATRLVSYVRADCQLAQAAATIWRSVSPLAVLFVVGEDGLVCWRAGFAADKSGELPMAGIARYWRLLSVWIAV